MGKPGTKSILSLVLSQSWVCWVLVEYHRKPPRQAVEQGQELCCGSSGPVLGPWDGKSPLKLKIRLKVKGMAGLPAEQAYGMRSAAKMGLDTMSRTDVAGRKITSTERRQHSKRRTKTTPSHARAGLKPDSISTRPSRFTYQEVSTLSCGSLRRSQRGPRWNAKALLFWETR